MRYSRSLGPGRQRRATLLLVAFLAATVPWRASLAGDKMRFGWVGNGGNCASCSWIQAAGEITAETPADFDRFAAAEVSKGFTLRNDMIALDSPGGNVTAAVDLGEAFRKAGVVTSVASARRRADSGDTPDFDMVPGHCQSACFFAFAGGHRRTLEPRNGTDPVLGSTLEIHRFAPDAGGQTVASAQQLSGMLSSFLTRMGIDAGILALAASVPDVPKGNMHVLTHDEAVRFAVVNMGLPPPSWNLKRTPDGRALVASLKGTAESDASSYNAWDFEAVLACQRTDRTLITLSLQIASDDPFPPGNTFMHDASGSFTFGLRWPGDGTTYVGTAATPADPVSQVHRAQDWDPAHRRTAPFDLQLAYSGIKDGKMMLVFVLGPKSVALIDNAETVAFFTEGKAHADQGWLPDEIPLPWQERANISGLLRNNCVATGHG